MPQKSVWLSFDLGVKGDYEGMYVFLDENGAVECGDSFAFFKFSYDSDLPGELHEALKAAVNFDKRSRVYLIYPSETGDHKGRFLVGKRKPSPWEGYGSTTPAEEDVGE